ncbi:MULTISPECIES: type 1 glutamine amidotransferase domain-containing protein [Cohnella]|uniref:type 1 glutamine amidotransferase domain-containing protein n=1 Tax=Cohnella TaxID=329857 RepID=UPI0009B97350|nr:MULTISPECIES: type 1 glutamine amidotransferase domain-containing protein [Cohnella]MBN2981950.1 type 1 glutamine amidotransferase [Cohnella algarum]
MKQSVRKVAFLLADGYEDSEMKNPYDAIVENGNDPVIIGLAKNQELRGKKGTISYRSHLTAKEANPEDYEAVIIPGGKSPAALREDEAIVDFVKRANGKGIPIAAICHGPQVLARAGLLGGKTLTGYAGIRGEIEEAGGTFVDREVAVDGNLITSRGPQDEPAFIQAIIDKIGVSAY